MAFRVHEFAEIGVFGQQYSSLIAGETKDNLVVRARRNLGNG